jgi:hypothetical protein
MSSCSDRSDSDEGATMEEVAVATTFAFVESPEVFMSKSRLLRADGVASSEEEEEEEAECMESPEIEFSLGGSTYRASRRGGSGGPSKEQLRRRLQYKNEKVENEKEVRRLLEEYKEQKYARRSSGLSKKTCMARVACACLDAPPEASIRCFGCKEYGCPELMCAECDAMIHSVGDNHKRERILEGNNGFGAAPALALKGPLIQPECTGCGKVKQGGETTKLVSVRIGTLSSGDIEVVS